MAAQIRPTRLEVSDRFPVLGFSIHADGPPRQAEIAIGADPGLFGIEGKARRTTSNFYSTRATGPVSIPNGDAVFVVPPDVLARFVGTEKLYFGLATQSDDGSAVMQIAVTPTSASPYVSLKGLTGRSMQRVRVLPRREQRTGYGDGAQNALEWAGDIATPGMEAVHTNGSATAPVAGNGAAKANGAKANGVKPNGAPAAASTQVPYDDGFGPMPPRPAAPVPAAPAPAAPTPAAPAQAQALQTGGFARSQASATSRLSPQARALIIDSDDVANGQLASAWLDLVRHDVQPAIVAALTARNINVQKLADAVGRFSIDRYEVSIDTLPTIDGEQLSAEAFLEYFRLHINDFIDTSNTIFSPYDSGVDDVKWTSASPTGAVLSIDFGSIPTADNAAVVASYATSNRWLFTTVHTPRSGDHPVSGTREFGVKQANGATVLYTRGVDRTTGIAEDIGESVVFSGQNALWRSMQQKVADFVNSHDGSASVVPEVVKHMNWNIIPTMYSVAGETLAVRPGRAARTLGANEAFTLNWDDVELVPQPTDKTCWAAAAAMVVGWRDQVCLDPETLAAICGRATDHGLKSNDNAAFAREMGLVAEPPQSYSFEGFRDLIARVGPLWVSEGTKPQLHAIVVTGLYSDGTNNYVRVSDPLDRVVGTPGSPGAYPGTHLTGSRYILTWDDFAAEYESAISGSPNVNVQILHAAGPTTRTPNTGQSTPAGYAQSRGLSNESFTINWDDVELIAQPTDVSCWAAAAAMVVGWKERVSLSVDSVSTICHRTTATGLDPAAVEKFAGEMGLTFEYPASYSVDAFRTLLTNHGPLWVGAAVPGLHAIVVTGLYSDGTDAFVRITDPWDRTVGSPGSPGAYLDSHSTGSRYIMKWDDFVAEYERAATDFASVNLQILHSGSVDDRTPNTGGSTPVGYAMSQRGKPSRAPATRAPARAARALAADQPRVIGADGGISWDLTQYPGMLNPSTALAASGAVDGEAITLSDWPYIDDADGSRTQAAVTIAWKYNAAGGVGDVRVGPGHGNTSPKRTLKITSTITEGNASPTRSTLTVTLRYLFKHPADGEQTAVTTIVLNGDGTHTRAGDWTSPARAAA